MSQKKYDRKDRWRSKVVGFSVSPEEGARIDMEAQISGLSKQDFILKCLLEKQVVIHPNIRVQHNICQHLDRLTAELRRLTTVDQTNDVLENLKYLLEIIERLSPNTTQN